MISPPRIFQNPYPAWSQSGLYQYGNTMAIPVRVDRIELSGWANTPQGAVPFSRLNLVPAQTGLQGWCNCPIRWQVGPVVPGWRNQGL